MPIIKDHGFCPNCNKDMPLEAKGLNHMLHAIGTFGSFVCGFFFFPLFGLAFVWGIIWVFASMGKREWRCTKCHYLAGQSAYDDQKDEESSIL